MTKQATQPTQATPAPPTVPAGLVLRADGAFVPESMVKDIDKLRDQTVEAIVKKALALQQALRDFKSSSFSDIAAFCEASAERFDTQVGGTKGNVTLRTFDGRFKVERAIQQRIAFDERLQAAKELIDHCITEWAENSRPEIRVLVNDAFQVDQEGRISTQRVLGLKRLAITDPKWLNAMEAIAESVTVVDSKAYVRVYERTTAGDYAPIALDIAKV